MDSTLAWRALTDLAGACTGSPDRRTLLEAALPPVIQLAGARAGVVLRQDHDTHVVSASSGEAVDIDDLASMLEVADESSWSVAPVPAAWAASGTTQALALRLPGAPEVLVLALSEEHGDVGEALEVATAMVTSAVGRCQAEEDLSDLHSRVDNAQQLAGMGDYDWNIATDTNRWSDQLYRIYGHEPQSFNASYERFLSLLHEDDREPIMAVHQAALGSGEPYQMVERIIRPSGEMRYLASNGQVVMDESGKPARMRGTCIDITDRVLGEQERARSAARFEQLVENGPEGILVVDSGRIVQANPVARQVLGGDPVGHTIDEIVALDGPVLQAVAATGVDGRALQLDVSTVALNELEEHEVAVFLYDAGPRLVREAVAANLREAQVRQRQAVEINDNVVQGLTAATYALETGDHARATTYARRTLGSARQMMRDLMASLEDKGVEAGDLVRSAASTLEPDPGPQLSSRTSAGTEADADEIRPRLLLVDDSEDLRAILRIQVERKLPGRVVGEAADGLEGVELAGALKPDLILLDLAMPRMDGLQALPLLRRAAPDAKVIVISGFDQRGLSAQVLQAGAMRYVEKGTSMADIVEIIREVCDGGPAPASA